MTKTKSYLPYLFAFLIACAGYFYFLTDGVFSVVVKAKSDFFDTVFADMFFRMINGDFTIDESLIKYEAFRKDGNVYSYFSVFPAVLRGIFAPFYDLKYFSVSRLLCFFGLSFSAGFLILIVKILAQKTKDNAQKYLLFLFGVALVFTGPQLYLSANASIYHEVIIYSMAFSSLFLYLFFKSYWVDENFSALNLSLMAVSAGLVLHNRVVVAISLYLALVVIILLQMMKEKKVFKIKFALPMFIMFVFGALALYVNYMRWGSPFSFADYSGYKAINESIVRTETFEHSGLFNIKRIPIAFLYYFTGSQSITLALDNYINVFFDGMEMPFLSSVLIQSFIMFFAILGAKKIYQDGEMLEKILTPVFAISVLLMLSFMYLALRYRGDFFVLFTFLSVFGINGFLQEFSSLKINEKRFFLFTITMLCVLSLLFSFRAMLIYRTGPINSLHKLALPNGFGALEWLLW